MGFRLMEVLIWIVKGGLVRKAGMVIRRSLNRLQLVVIQGELEGLDPHYVIPDALYNLN